MRSRWFDSLAALLVGGGVALAQSSTAPEPVEAARPAIPKPRVRTADSGQHVRRRTDRVACPGGRAADGGVLANDPLGDPVGNPANPPIGESEYSNYHFWATAQYLQWHLPSGHVRNVTAINERADLLRPLGGVADFAFQNTTVLPGTPISATPITRGCVWMAAFGWTPPATGAWKRATSPSKKRSSGANAEQQTDINVNTPFFTLFSVPNPSGGSPTTTTVPSTLPATLVIDLHADTSSSLWGTEANVHCHRVFFGTASVDLLAGFRYLNLEEDLSVSDSISLSPTGPLNAGGTTILIPPTSFQTFDSYNVRNQYYGARSGAEFEWYEGRVFVNGSAKIAVGDMHQEVDINGYTITPSGQVAGGLLTQEADIGQHTRDRVAFVPELTLGIGYQVTPHIRVYVGYDGLDIRRVARRETRSATPTARPTSPSRAAPRPPPWSSRPSALRTRKSGRRGELRRGGPLLRARLHKLTKYEGERRGVSPP